jgi:hypothetical protein
VVEYNELNHCNCIVCIISFVQLKQFNLHTVINNNNFLIYITYIIIMFKIQVTKDLGGAGAWEVELDDYANLCGCGHFPLLRAANFPDCDVPDCV